jgi:hypothetical protein
MRFADLFLALLICSAAQAQVRVPNTLTDGTPAPASDVNANFQALRLPSRPLAPRPGARETRVRGYAGTSRHSGFKLQLLRRGWAARREPFSPFRSRKPT